MWLQMGYYHTLAPREKVDSNMFFYGNAAAFKGAFADAITATFPWSGYTQSKLQLALLCQIT